ncbi:hypothetical protein BK254_26845 [Escherichia coli]|nr:hypothetical protein BK254_26845 [Escherichia coli]
MGDFHSCIDQMGDGAFGFVRLAEELHNHKSQNPALNFRHAGKQDIHLDSILTDNVGNNRPLLRRADQFEA